MFINFRIQYKRFDNARYFVEAFDSLFRLSSNDYKISDQHRRVVIPILVTKMSLLSDGTEEDPP